MRIKNFTLATAFVASLVGASGITLAQMSVQTDESSVEINNNGVSVQSGDRSVNIRDSNDWDSPTRQPRTPRTNSSQPQQPQQTTIQRQRTPSSGRSNGEITINQSQESTINISSANLRRPYTLRVSTATAGARLNGEVRLNGAVVQRLRNNRTEINLSPRLSRGSNTIEISGTYRPASSSVRIEFVGSNTRISQQNQGSGSLNQTLTVNVN